MLYLSHILSNCKNYLHFKQSVKRLFRMLYAFTQIRTYTFKTCAVCPGMKVPITSSVYVYTKVLAHNLNSKKTSGAAIG